MSLALTLNLIWILCQGFHHLYFLTSTTQFYFTDVLWMILTSRCIQNICPAPLHLSLQYNQISYPLIVLTPFFNYVITVTFYHVFPLPPAPPKKTGYCLLCLIIMRTFSGTRLFGFEFQLCHLPAMWFRSHFPHYMELSNYYIKII